MADIFATHSVLLITGEFCGTSLVALSFGLFRVPVSSTKLQLGFSLVYSFMSASQADLAGSSCGVG